MSLAVRCSKFLQARPFLPPCFLPPASSLSNIPRILLHLQDGGDFVGQIGDTEWLSDKVFCADF